MKRLFAFGALAALLLAPLAVLAQPGVTLPYFRPYDQTGLHMFETPIEVVEDAEDVEAPTLRWGVAFAQQFQSLNHENAAAPVMNGDGVNMNQLADIGSNFNLATANLNLDAYLAEGVRVNVVTYLSARHHPEAWVKGGYLQVDEVGFLGSPGLDRVFENLTVRAGHFEVNYGDAHFRRSDNGNAFHNPFVENLIMDSFATEVGAEVYYQNAGFLGMVGLTGGDLNPGVNSPDRRSPAYYGKVGYDNFVAPDLRVRLTGSAYTNRSSTSNTLYSGDRAGSRYYLVMENTMARSSSQFRSGRLNPGFTGGVTAFMINPFVKYRGLELFGTMEFASGRSGNETDDRNMNQYAAEALFRFLPREQVYVGGRYNVVNGDLRGAPDITVDRVALVAGWFPTRNILLKGEAVWQGYDGFPADDIHAGGSFNGFVIEGVVAF